MFSAPFHRPEGLPGTGRSGMNGIIVPPPFRGFVKKREGKPVPTIAEATIVPAGVVRLVELQEAGYAYLKP
jgi:hypothetical protein